MDAAPTSMDDLLARTVEAHASDLHLVPGAPPAVRVHGELVSLAEVRYVHSLTMTPVWDVAPHPQATDREGPGSFREHDIEPLALRVGADSIDGRSLR